MARILIIGDKVVCDSLSVFLLKAGHEPLPAGDRITGLQLFRSSSPDLVVLDRDLPGFAGRGGLAHVEKLAGKVPLVVLSGCRADAERDDCLRCGAAVYLPKSGGLPPVLYEVDRLLGAIKICADPAGEGSGERARPLVLVVDDQPEVCELLSSFLLSIGCDAICAEDGASAEALARARRPDIVLLDIFMPDKNGLEVLGTISSEQPGCGVVMISGNDDERLARGCLRAGAFDYMSKPLNLDVLRKIIKARLLLRGK